MSKESEFVDLCRQLRDLGALTVSSGDMTATFSPARPKIVTKAEEDDTNPSERFPSRRR